MLTMILVMGATVVAMRWLFHAGRPRDDVAAVERMAARVGEVVRDVCRVLWRAYGPITDEMREAWVDLAMKYRRGDYGVEGT